LYRLCFELLSFDFPRHNFSTLHNRNILSIATNAFCSDEHLFVSCVSCNPLMDSAIDRSECEQLARFSAERKIGKGSPGARATKYQEQRIRQESCSLRYNVTWYQYCSARVATRAFVFCLAASVEYGWRTTSEQRKEEKKRVASPSNLCHKFSRGVKQFPEEQKPNVCVQRALLDQASLGLGF